MLTELSTAPAPGVLYHVDIRYDLSDGQEDVETLADLLVCVPRVDVPEEDIKCFELTQGVRGCWCTSTHLMLTLNCWLQGNEEIFDSADAWIRTFGVPAAGPLLQLTPHRCRFEAKPIEISFDVSNLVKGDGPGFFVVRMSLPT